MLYEDDDDDKSVLKTPVITAPKSGTQSAFTLHTPCTQFLINNQQNTVTPSTYHKDLNTIPLEENK